MRFISFVCVIIQHVSEQLMQPQFLKKRSCILKSSISVTENISCIINVIIRHYKTYFIGMFKSTAVVLSV